jgi:phosphatidylinositol-3-phosphatase
MRLALITALIALTALLPRTLAADQGGISRFQHVFLIIEENHERSDIIGNSNAPNLNKYATTYAQATNYFGVTHPSEPNYVAGVGGDYFGIQDDDAYNCQSNATTPPPPAGGPGCGSHYATPPGYPPHTVSAPNLAQQLDEAGVSWKGYFQSMPNPGFTGTCAPGPGSQCLYASKHNGFINFTSVQNSQSDLNRMVPLDGPGGQLAADLQSGNVPNFSYIVPDQCHDMHGLGSCPSTQANIAAADTYAGTIVDEILKSPVWKEGNNAIIITFDEGNSDQGCCVTNPNGNPGGGKVYTAVISNHGPDGGFQDSTPYNHYSLLRTIESAFNLGCIANSCNVQPMLPLIRK